MKQFHLRKKNNDGAMAKSTMVAIEAAAAPVKTDGDEIRYSVPQNML